MKNDNPRLDELLSAWNDGRLDEDGVAELKQLMASPAGRRQATDTWLLISALEQRFGQASHSTTKRRVRSARKKNTIRLPAALIAAASIVIAVVGWFLITRGDSGQAFARIANPGAETVVFRDQERLTNLKKDFLLLAGDTIHAADAEGVRLRLIDEPTTIQLANASILHLDRSPKQTQLLLKQGTVDCVVASQSPRRTFAVHTSTSEVRVIGTQFRVAHRPGSDEIRVHEGVVNVVRIEDGTQVKLEQAECTVVATGLPLAVMAIPEDASAILVNLDFENSRLPKNLSGKLVRNTTGSKAQAQWVVQSVTDEEQNLSVRWRDFEAGVVTVDADSVLEFDYRLTKPSIWVSLFVQRESPKGEYSQDLTARAADRWHHVRVPFKAIPWQPANRSIQQGDRLNCIAIICPNQPGQTLQIDNIRIINP